MLEGTEKVLQLLRSFDNDCNVWFLSENDGKIVELKDNSNASIIAEDENNCWLSISGTIDIIIDRELIKSLWKEDYLKWFPQGVDSPGIRALQFNSERAEYWDQRKEHKIQYAFKAVKAYVSGVTPAPDKKSHETVKL